MTATTTFLSRLERFDRVGSTNDVVRGWLESGTPEVCVAVADEQTAGRGRAGRAWIAPPGAGLLVSLGFRPSWLDPELTWRLPAIVSLAMADAAERAAGLAAGTVGLKWPNDLVVDARRDGAGPRKLAGVLGESAGLGGDDPTVIVGIGLNVNWSPDAFPPELAETMTSLLAAAHGRPVDGDDLLRDFIEDLEGRLRALRAGTFDGKAWADRQITTGRLVEIQSPSGSADVVRATGVDDRTGALLVDDEGEPRSIFVGEIRHVRLAAV